MKAFISAFLVKTFEKCFFHPLNLEGHKIVHPHHDAVYPVLIYSCSKCGYYKKEEAEKTDWKLKGATSGPWGVNYQYERLDKPIYTDKKVWDGEKK